MEEIFNNIIDAKSNLEEVFAGLGSRTLQDYYALFIAEMAYNNYIEISPDFSAILYVSILNSDMKDIDEYLGKINDFIVNKAIREFEKEPVDEPRSTQS